MKPIYLLLLLCMTGISCKNETENETFSKEEKTETSTTKLAKLHWLLGVWTNQSGDEFSKETWRKANDSTFTGFSYTQVEMDTVFAETMKIQELGGELLLTVVAYNQNNDVPITFKMIGLEKTKAVFENKAHDFPQRIVYTNPKRDSIHAWVEGTVQKELMKIDFYFNRN